MLRTLWQRWKGLAEKIGTVQAQLILGLLYLILLGPIALLRRLGADPLGRRPTGAPTYWRPRPPTEATLAQARRQ